MISYVMVSNVKVDVVGDLEYQKEGQGKANCGERMEADQISEEF